MPAGNKRFGVSRGVTSRKVLWEFESLLPVRALVFSRPNETPSRHNDRHRFFLVHLSTRSLVFYINKPLFFDYMFDLLLSVE